MAFSFGVVDGCSDPYAYQDNRRRQFIGRINVSTIGIHETGDSTDLLGKNTTVIISLQINGWYHREIGKGKFITRSFITDTVIRVWDWIFLTIYNTFLLVSFPILVLFLIGGCLIESWIFRPTLETVQDDVLAVTYLLVDEEILDIGTLVTTKLDDFADVLVLLDGTVTTEVLLEGLADPFDV